MEKKDIEIFASDAILKEHLAKLTTETSKGTSLASYSIFNSSAAKNFDMENTVLNFKSSKYSKDVLVDRAIGSLMALAMGDSVGSQTEGFPVNFEEAGITDFDPKFFTRRNMVAGNVTDDASMANCLADTLILCKGLNCKDFLKRCVLWWFYGYNNFTGLADTEPRVSHGMGSITKASLMNFINSKYTKTISTNSIRPSNGCIMRLAPISLYYYPDIKEAMDKAVEQARTTHVTGETDDASRIVAYLIVKALGYTKIYNNEKDFGKEFLDSLDFSEVIPLLATENAKKLVKAEDKWNWKAKGFNFPLGGSGLIALEGLAMALHISYTEESITKIILKATNIGGDSDTIAAIAGQIMGALYGISSIPTKWSELILKWDRRGETALKATLLIKKEIH